MKKIHNQLVIEIYYYHHIISKQLFIKVRRESTLTMSALDKNDMVEKVEITKENNSQVSQNSTSLKMKMSNSIYDENGNLKHKETTPQKKSYVTNLSVGSIIHNNKTDACDLHVSDSLSKRKFEVHHAGSDNQSIKENSQYGSPISQASSKSRGHESRKQRIEINNSFLTPPRNTETTISFTRDIERCTTFSPLTADNLQHDERSIPVIQRKNKDFVSVINADAASIISNQSHSTTESSDVFRTRCTVSVDELMGDDPKLRKTVIYLLLLRIVSSGNNNESRPYTVKNFKKKSYNEAKSNYSRLFLCFDLHSLSGQTVYIAQGKGIGANLWAKAANRRDNGSIGIGTILAVANPKPITKLLANEVPIIESNSSLLICECSKLKNIYIDSIVPEQCTRGFVLNCCEISVKTAELINSDCSGYFCDRQRSCELLRTGKKCGCYVMRGFSSNISVNHGITVDHSDSGTNFQMEDFSSMKFSLLYLSEYFPKSTKRISFDVTDNEDRLYEAIDKVVNFYNVNGGFTVIGWYKRGEVNDLNKIDENNEKVSSSVISHHVTTIYPTLYKESHAKNTEDMKFNVLNIM